jgi:ferric-dicitrate binding protein FerR (iron transport regulator)
MTNPSALNRIGLANLLLAALLLALATQARAQDFVGWVSALEGTAEVLRAGGADWAALAPADGLSQGDQVRTQAGARMKILLRDDSVLTLGESSQLRLDEQVAGPAPQSTFWLMFGRIRAIATERYGAAGARFEVKTPTAIAGVRGTEFVAQHDTAEEETLVVGIVDTTTVRAAIDAAGGRAIRLGPGQSTRIRRGSYPSPAETMPAGQIRSLVDATATKGGDLGAQRPKTEPEVQAEPRLPTRPGDRDGSPVERVVDDPFVRGGGPKRPAPPPPPPPGN